MMTIAICEDETYFSAILYRMVGEYLKDKQVSAAIIAFASGEELLSFEKKTDIILMDIKLSGLDGMKTAQQLRNNGNDGQFIFVTAYAEYVFRSFDVDAVHYILKPVKAPELYVALGKAVKRMKHNTEKALLILHEGIASRIAIKDILYCEVFNHQVSVYTMTEEYSYCGTLDAIEKELDERFFRCHRSFIVNMDFVIDKGANSAIISGGHKVLIARRKQQEFTQKLLESCRRGTL